MASSRRTTEDYVNMMRHALGKTPTQTGNKAHKLIQDLNDAGRALVNDHPWSWRTRTRCPLDLIANQPFVDLPEDFGEVIDVSTEGGTSITVVQTSIQDINRFRQWNQYDAYSLHIAFKDAFEEPTGDGVNQLRAQIFPTPAADRSDVYLTYRASWVDLDESDLNRVPVIPRDWERSLVLFSRSFAIDIENQVDPYENQALFGPSGELARLRTHDASRQSDYGLPRHDVLSRGKGVVRPHRSISR